MAPLPAHLRKLYPFRSHFFELPPAAAAANGSGADETAAAVEPLGEGAVMHYLDEGSGPPVLLLHGNPTWSFYYRNVVAALRNRFRVIAPDHIGCGLSSKPQNYQYCLRSHSANLSALVDHLQLKSIALVVHDWGGPIGLHFAVQHPQLVSKLVILNTACSRLPSLPAAIRICQIPLLGDLLVRRLNLFLEIALRVGVSRHKLAAEIRDGYRLPYRDREQRTAILRFVQDIPLWSKHPSHSALREIEAGIGKLQPIPALLLWGDKDPVFTAEYLADIQRHFPAAAVRRFSHAGHWLLEDECDQVIRELQRFLGHKSNNQHDDAAPLPTAAGQ